MPSTIGGQPGIPGWGGCGDAEPWQSWRALSCYAGMLVQANDGGGMLWTPISDRSSYFRRCFLSPHACNVAVRRWSLSSGRPAVKVVVSSLIPRKVRRVNGPSTLSFQPLRCPRGHRHEWGLWTESLFFRWRRSHLDCVIGWHPLLDEDPL